MVGRPPKYDDPEVLAAGIAEYFEKEDKPTITGLCLFLGFESRQSFYAMEQRPDFSYTIKRARTQLEQVYEKYLLRDGQVTGPIFALKNLGWTDKTQVENTHILPQIELRYEPKEDISGNEGSNG